MLNSISRNPNSASLDPSQGWIPYSSPNKSYISLDVSEKIHIGHKLKEKQCAFWNTYIPKLVNTIGKSNKKKLK